MASKHIYLSGTTMWAKVHKPDEKYNVYKMDLYLDEPSLKKFKESGMQVSLKDSKDDPTKQFISVRRNPAALIKGKLGQFGPPEVLDKDNNPTDALIGNGSKVTCKITVYDTIKGKGHRLEAVRIEDLVSYEAGSEDVDNPF